MCSAGMRQIVAELIFLLVSLGGKSGDGRDELIVAKGFKAGGGEKTGGEGEIESFADGAVAGLGVMEADGREGEGADGGWSELELLVDEHTVVVRMGRGACRGQSALLEKVVLGVVAIERGTEERLRARGFGPVHPCGEKRFPVRSHDRRRHRADGANIRKKPCGSQLLESAELRERIGTVGHAGIFVD